MGTSETRTEPTSYSQVCALKLHSGYYTCCLLLHNR